jgi:citrate synthase
LPDFDKVTLNVGDSTVELAVIAASQGPSGIDISKLMADTGLTSFDPAFVNTASTKSAITYIDGDEGILRYRGYPIEQVAELKSFTESAFLLIYGKFPSVSELKDFELKISERTERLENLDAFFNAFPNDAHPMAVLSASVSALSTFYPDSLDPKDPEAVEEATLRLLAMLPVVTAYSYKASLGQAFVAPRPELSMVENFLNMTFGSETEPLVQNPIVTKALDTLLLLHADHEQNCSTSTVRLVGSSQANLYASVSAGVNALSGPLHGGANEAVIQMLELIHQTSETVETYVERVKNKEDSVRLMGFGHRVYKSFDPRAQIVKATADQVLSELGVNDPLLDVAKQLEAIALADEYFVERKLYPNVDFYTGVIYKALGFPSKMFTPLFAIGRLPGWIAHWREMNSEPNTRISRPQQVYVGEPERSI